MKNFCCSNEFSLKLIVFLLFAVVAWKHSLGPLSRVISRDLRVDINPLSDYYHNQIKTCKPYAYQWAVPMAFLFTTVIIKAQK